MKWIICLCLFVGLLFSEETAVVTVPKAGTHLIQKLLKLAGGENNIPIYHADEFYGSKELQEQYSRRILLVRDPRDVCLSWIRYVVSGQADTVDAYICALPDSAKEQWKKLGLEKQLEHVIRGASLESRSAGVHPTLIYFPLSPYREAAKHAGDEETLIVKFENLVGPKGGGSRHAQEEEARKIFTFLGLDLSKERTHKVLKELFGGTRTFSKGRTGGWKKSFSRKNRKRFKKRHQDLLVTFGYPG